MNKKEINKIIENNGPFNEVAAIERKNKRKLTFKPSGQRENQTHFWA